MVAIPWLRPLRRVTETTMEPPSSAVSTIRERSTKLRSREVSQPSSPGARPTATNPLGPWYKLPTGCSMEPQQLGHHLQHNNRWHLHRIVLVSISVEPTG